MQVQTLPQKAIERRTRARLKLDLHHSLVGMHRNNLPEKVRIVKPIDRELPYLNEPAHKWAINHQHKLLHHNIRKLPVFQVYQRQ